MSNRSLNLDDTLYEYLLTHSLREHPEQIALREATRSHPRAGMQISPEQGQFMALLVKLLGARRTLEIGVFTGYSALSVALALPDDGRILACDISAEFTSIGRPHWERAGVARKIDLRLAPTTSPSSMPTRPATPPTSSAACNCCVRVASSRSTTCCGAVRWRGRHT